MNRPEQRKINRTGPDVPKQPETSSRTDQPCGLLRRLLVMLYDGLVVIAILMLATAVAMLLGMENRIAGKDPLYTLGLLLVWFAYLGWCWSRGGMTMGMRAWKVRIETDAGARPGWGLCAIRFLVSWLSAAVAGAGFAWSLFRSDRKTWHDLASKTRLLQATKAGPEKSKPSAAE
jgi:uncharacterized RDD family membrane protein YckC